MKNHITAIANTSIDAGISKVWDALTKPEIIKQYFFGTDVKSDWKVGSPIVFTGEWQGKSYKDKGTILKVERNKIFKYNYWSSMSGIEEKPENYVDITYELSEYNHKTNLTIVQENIPDQKMKEHSEQNWRKVLEDLKELLENK